MQLLKLIQGIDLSEWLNFKKIVVLLANISREI
jgi:hypothetical protein